MNRSLLLSLLALLLVAGCDAEVEVEGDEPGECSDQTDNDQDGAADCDDDGCAADGACTGDDDDSAGQDDDRGDDHDPAGDDDDSAGDDDDSAGDDDDSAVPSADCPGAFSTAEGPGCCSSPNDGNDQGRASCVAGVWTCAQGFLCTCNGEVAQYECLDSCDGTLAALPLCVFADHWECPSSAPVLSVDCP